LLVGLVLDNKIVGRIDQVNQRLELYRQYVKIFTFKKLKYDKNIFSNCLLFTLLGHPILKDIMLLVNGQIMCLTYTRHVLIESHNKGGFNDNI
jgi:hypothetical protein